MSLRMHIWPDYALEWDAGRIVLTRPQGVILSRLVSGRSIGFDDLTDALYGDREDGGPLDTDGAIGQAIHKLRKKLAGSPFRINRTESRYVRLELNALDAVSDNFLSNRKVDE